MTDSRIRIAEIRARLDAATAGPWSHDGPCATGYALYVYGDGGIVCDYPRIGGGEARADANADLIANAPADLAWCVAELDRLTRVESAARALVAALPKCDRCDKPATCAFRCGDRLCDGCVGQLRPALCSIPPEYPRAAPLRELVTLFGDAERKDGGT